MIQRQFYRTRKDGVNLYVTFSDESWKIYKKGDKNKFLYSQAVDIEGSINEYEEGDIKVMHTAEEVKWMDEHGVQYYIR